MWGAYTANFILAVFSWAYFCSVLSDLISRRWWVNLAYFFSFCLHCLLNQHFAFNKISRQNIEGGRWRGGYWLASSSPFPPSPSPTSSLTCLSTVEATNTSTPPWNFSQRAANWQRSKNESWQCQHFGNIWSSKQSLTIKQDIQDIPTDHWSQNKSLYSKFSQYYLSVCLCARLRCMI